MYVFLKYCCAASAENSGWAFCIGGWKMLWENLFGSFLKEFSAAILFLCSCFFNNKSLSFCVVAARSGTASKLFVLLLFLSNLLSHELYELLYTTFFVF